MNLNRRIFTILSAAVFTVAGFSQTGPLSIADLDREAEKTAAAVREFIRPGGMGSIRNDGMTGASPLGVYWIETILARLAGADNRGITIFDSPSARSGYVLRCSILELGPVVRIHTRLVRSFDFSVAAAWTTDLTRTPYLDSLLDGPRGHWDTFESDSREQPVPLEIDGAEISRSLNESDRDWFSVSPEKDGYVVVTTSGQTDTYIELYTDSFDLIAENDDGPDNYNARLGFIAERGKTHIVLVRGYSGDETGPYGIRAFFSDIPDKDMEPNDSMNNAFSIWLDTPVQAFIITDDEQDWYRLVLSGGYFTARTMGDIDTYLELYDAAGRKLAEDDDSNYDTNAKISLLLEAGVYYVKVSAYEKGEYTLRCTEMEPNLIDAYEPDDRQEDAKTISIGEEQIHSFTTEDDVDWVRFTVDLQGAYNIRAWGIENSDLDTYLSLYDSTGSLIDENDDAGETYASSITTDLSPGLYYIRVHVLEYPSGSYKLALSLN
ncbi:MAG: PPC domain-containing protein [Treponema sp.]|jgi:hypothetical protein|nr:PPC domain-containing protein [Treponema sp.]